MSADGDSAFRLHAPIEQASGEPSEHGGDLAASEARYGRPRDGWLDLSTGINPRPYRPGPLALETVARLPQTDAQAGLLQAAGAYYGLPVGARLVAGAGSQALIQWLPYLFSPRAVGILGPTYGEHAKAWNRAGHAVRTIDSLGDGLGDDLCEIIVVGNPNNPDGRILSPELLIATARRLAAQGGLLVVDEAFADTAPEISLVGACGRPGLVVLRSFGKFFGLAGLRVGFAATDHSLAARLADAIGPWPLSGPALAVAIRAYRDSAWIAAARTQLAGAARRRDRLLARHGLARLGGTDLFALFGHEAAPFLADHLGRAGILVRRFATQPTWLRFGLPGRAESWRRLGAALALWQREQNRNV